MRISGGYLLVGNQACHRSNQRAKPADVSADNQLRIVITVTAEQHRRRYIADNLAYKHTYQYLVS